MHWVKEQWGSFNFGYGRNARLSTGVVTTSRLTHATPASVYAHSADRNWESTADETCKDIGKYYFTIAAKPKSSITFISCNISMSE